MKFRRSEPVSRPEVWTGVRGSYHAFGQSPQISSIVVFKVDHIGDLVLGLDALLALRALYPRAAITLICAPWNVKIAEALEVADRVVPLRYFEPRADTAFTPPRSEDVARLGLGRFDLAIDLRVDPDTRWLLDCVDARYRFGYRSDRNAEPLTVALELPIYSGGDLGSHQSVLMLRLVDTVRSLFESRRGAREAIHAGLVAPARPEWLDGLPRPIVAINTASGREAKNWPAEWFGELIGWLCGPIGLGVALLGTADQGEEAERIVRGCGSSNLRSLVGKTTLNEALGVIAASDLFIGNDTSTTHLSARMGVPTVAIFSGIDPITMWAPIGPDVTIIRNPVPCSPCHILHLSDCDYHHQCLRGIGVGFVKDAVRSKLLSLSKGHAASAVEPVLADVS